MVGWHITVRTIPLKTLQTWPVPMYMGTLWYGGRMFVWKRSVWGSNINKEQWCVHMKTLQYSPLFSMLTFKNVLERAKKIVNCRKAKIRAYITCGSYATVICTYTLSFPQQFSRTCEKWMKSCSQQVAMHGFHQPGPQRLGNSAWPMPGVMHFSKHKLITTGELQVQSTFLNLNTLSFSNKASL